MNEIEFSDSSKMTMRADAVLNCRRSHRNQSSHPSAEEIALAWNGEDRKGTGVSGIFTRLAYVAKKYRVR